MGQKYEFWCESCGYEAQVSGGEDAGELVCTQTVACQQCESLYDVTTAKRDLAVESFFFREVEPRCPRRKTHSIREWEHPGPCPKCGEDMHQGGLEMLWD